MNKIHFTKNIFGTLLLFLNTILFFKVLTFYAVPHVLAEYFAIKAFASIFFFGFSIRFPEILYVLRGKLGLNLNELTSIHFCFLVFTCLLIMILLLVSYLILEVALVYISAFFVLVSNEIIESYISMQRLFNRYNLIILIRCLLFIKPLVILWLLYSEIFAFDAAYIIFVYEMIIIFILFFIYGALNFSRISEINKSKIILIQNLDVIKNTWLASVSKISYDALPNYLLSFYSNELLYTQYNIARKIYGLIHSAQLSFVQVFNTGSIELRDKFEFYLTRYYKVMIGLNFLSLLGVLILGKFFIIVMTKETYATDMTIYLILVFVLTAFLYVLFYPIRQWYILNKLIDYNNKGLRISMFALLLITIVSIPIFGEFAAAIIQPLGLLLPIIFTLFFLEKNQISTIKNLYISIFKTK